MFPDLPLNHKDLTPLPRCDGPKLKPFPFGGPQQKIEFLQYVGEGIHAHVFKVKIMGSIYALKMFFFDPSWWAAGDPYEDDMEVWSAHYEYSDPFNCECRAFGRLQETGYEHLALKAYGYILLDESNERSLMEWAEETQRSPTNQYYVPWEIREELRSKGRSTPAPIRCIVKEFGQDHDQKTIDMKFTRSYLRDVVQMHQLGIFHLDTGSRQVINGKHGDFSQAVTTPHYCSTPELNPHITPDLKAAMELDVFSICLDDYVNFDEMLQDWNNQHKKKGRVTNYVLTGTYRQRKYNLRSTPRRDRLYTLIDPRKFDWKAHLQNQGGNANGIVKKRCKLDPKPSRWYLESPSEYFKQHLTDYGAKSVVDWEYRDGYFFPVHRWGVTDYFVNRGLEML